MTHLLSKGNNEIQVLLPSLAFAFIVKNRDIYDLLLEKSKQANMSVRVLVPYNIANEQYLSKLKEDSKYMIKVHHIRNELKLNQIVFLVDNNVVYIITLRKDGYIEGIEYGTYSNKEYVVLCYVNLFEYQSLVSEI